MESYRDDAFVKIFSLNGPKVTYRARGQTATKMRFSQIILRAARLIRERVDVMAVAMTPEEGKQI
jgi:hypothetical protein